MSDCVVCASVVSVVYNIISLFWATSIDDPDCKHIVKYAIISASCGLAVEAFWLRAWFIQCGKNCGGQKCLYGCATFWTVISVIVALGFLAGNIYGGTIYSTSCSNRAKTVAIMHIAPLNIICSFIIICGLIAITVNEEEKEIRRKQQQQIENELD